MEFLRWNLKKTQIVRKHKIFKCDETKIFTIQIVTQLKNSNFDKIQMATKL